MSFWANLFSSRKASQAGIVVSVGRDGRAQSSPRNYESFSKEAYQKNVIAHRAVSQIAKACGGIPWVLYKKRSGAGSIEQPEHEYMNLLKRPNPTQGQSAFFGATVSYYLIAGNSFIESVKPSPNAKPAELWSLRPDRMKIVPGKFGTPAAYEFDIGGQTKRFDVDVIRNKSSVLHLKSFNPLNDWYGMSAIESAVYAVDQHNEAGKWNFALLKNEAKPSGVLKVKHDDRNPSGRLSDDQYKRLKEQISDQYQGASNAGRPMLLEGGLEWQQLSFSPKDMDWIEGKNTSARDVALAFGYPPQLLGIPGDNTYSNYKEARMALYEETILPLMDFVRDEFNNSITPVFGEGLYLDYDRDAIEALAPKRESKWIRIETSNFLTINEKRDQLGYDPVPGGDVVLVQASLVPIENAGAASVERSESAEEVAKAISIEPEVKLVNLLNRNEKLRAARAVNARRQELEKAFSLDLEECLKEQAIEISEAVAKASSQLAELAAMQAVEMSSGAIRLVLKKHLRKASSEFGQDLLSGGKSFGATHETKSLKKFSEFVDSFVVARADATLSRIEGTTIKKARAVIRDTLLQSLEEGSGQDFVANQIKEKLTGLSTSRSHLIARTEISVASSQGSLAAAKALEVPGLKKEWVCVNDDRTRDDAGEADHRSMNGVRVGIDEKFTVPPDASMDGPGDPSAPVEQVARCRCVLVYSRGE